MEPLLEAGQLAGVHRQLVGLAAISEVCLLDVVRGAEIPRGRRAHLLERAPERRLVELAHRREDGRRVVPPGLADGEPQRRQHTARLRHEDRGHPELLGQRARVHGAGAAERDDGELARIQPAPHADHPQRPDHLDVRHLDDPGGRFEHVDAEPLRDPAHRVLGEVPA